jgi:outer membrane protein OmpA-like peptidoglycan-associated protein
VERYAQAELKRAQSSLRQAQATWHEKSDVDATSHLAYLAHQHAETAIELGKERAAEESMHIAAADRDSMVATLPKSDQQLQQELAGLPAQATNRGIVVTLPKERFAFNQAALPADTGPMIDHLANVLKQNPERKVAIEGHTDNEGSQAYNRTLAQERAEEIRKALISRGIAPNRIIMRSYGEANPVASNDTRHGRRENRRAEVIISDAHGHIKEPSMSGGETSTGGNANGETSSGK